MSESIIIRRDDYDSLIATVVASRSQLAAVTDERDKWRKEHRAMSKGGQTNAKAAQLQAAKIAELRAEGERLRNALIRIIAEVDGFDIELASVVDAAELINSKKGGEDE